MGNFIASYLFENPVLSDEEIRSMWRIIKKTTKPTANELKSLSYCAQTSLSIIKAVLEDAGINVNKKSFIDWKVYKLLVKIHEEEGKPREPLKVLDIIGLRKENYDNGGRLIVVFL